ncbi:MAG: LD-carboxypeptidase [Bacteroidetes bacterium]|nr:LD-carboxypeptidase [Bacteroidota bacterium]MCW5895719.1 LD-carboxypeptidase [Bacteroidota bacterium]
MITIHPPKLKKGDLIGIISPSSPIADASRIEKGVRYLESLGYRVLVGENVGKTSGYLAGTDEQRVADLHAMFSDSRVKAIICVRGGYGTPRLLSLFNYNLAARNPKILVGFSDVTALQLALWKKCRLVTFHGPMAGVEMANQIDPFTEELFWRLLTASKKIGAIHFPSEPAPESLVQGKASGVLLGGNLSLVVSLMGTQYQPDFTNSILFLEEIAEEPYRVDRMLTQLRNGLVFSKANGMLLGQFTDCKPLDATKPSHSAQQVLEDAVKKFGKPVLANLPFGHVPKKLTLPLGVNVKLNSTTKTLRFLEAAVR